MQTYQWTVKGEKKEGTLAQFVKVRLVSGSKNCTTPEGVEFVVEETRRNVFVGVARNCTTGESARTDSK